MEQLQNNTPRVPQLRFREFAGDWGRKKLGEIAEKVGSGSTPLGGDKVYQDSGVLFIRSQNVNNDQLILEDIAFISEEINAKMAGSLVRANDILLNITGASLGRSCVVPNNFNIGNVNQHVCIIRLNSDNNSIFIQAFLSSSKGQKLMMEGQTGSGREGLNFQSIRGFNIALPTLPEQTRIANFLTATDEKLQALRKKKNLLEQYKKGVMQQIFSRQIRFREENGAEFGDWEEKKLGEVAERKTIKNKNNLIKNVFTNSAFSGIVNQRDYFDKDIANQNNLLNYYVVENDDFVYNPRISNLAPVGPISRNHLQTGVMSPLYSVFKINKGNLDFFEIFFSTSGWHEYMESIANYGARSDRMSIKIDDFYLMPLPYPTLPEQTRIANFLTALDEKINRCQEQIGRMEIWKKGLLQQLFV